MSAKMLYDYMLYHTYTSFAGILGAAIGLLFIVAFFFDMGLIYLIAGLVVTLYLPWTLFLRANNQMKTTKVFQKPLHYTFSEEGITISQEEMSDTIPWDLIIKVVSTNKSIIIYTSKINASILPKYQLGEELSDVIQIISTNMAPSKVNIKG